MTVGEIHEVIQEKRVKEIVFMGTAEAVRLAIEFPLKVGPDSSRSAGGKTLQGLVDGPRFFSHTIARVKKLLWKIITRIMMPQMRKRQDQEIEKLPVVIEPSL